MCTGILQVAATIFAIGLHIGTAEQATLKRPIAFNPPSRYAIAPGELLTVAMSPTAELAHYISRQPHSCFTMHIRNQQSRTLTINKAESHRNELLRNATVKHSCRESSDLSAMSHSTSLFMHFQSVHVSVMQSAASYNFSLTASTLGYGHVQVFITEGNSSMAAPKEIYRTTYTVQSMRQHRLADTAFDCTVTVFVFFNMFSLGSIIKVDAVRAVPANSRTLGVACFTEFVMVPLVALAITKIAMLDWALATGLFCIAVLPGGGFARFVLEVVNEDKGRCNDSKVNLWLSDLLGLLTILVPIGLAPLWLLGAVRYLGYEDTDDTSLLQVRFSDTSLLVITAFLLALVLPFTLGMGLKHFHQQASAAILNWVIQPAQLLAAISFATLGVYTNRYITEALGTNAIIASSTLSPLTLVFAALAALATGINGGSALTIATETSVSNSAAAIVVLRYALPQPDADIASAVAIYSQLFAPVPFVALLVIQKACSCISVYMEPPTAQQEQVQSTGSAEMAAPQQAGTAKAGGAAGALHAEGYHARSVAADVINSSAQGDAATSSQAPVTRLADPHTRKSKVSQTGERQAGDVATKVSTGCAKAAQATTSYTRRNRAWLARSRQSGVSMMQHAGYGNRTSAGVDFAQLQARRQKASTGSLQRCATTASPV